MRHEHLIGSGGGRGARWAAGLAATLAMLSGCASTTTAPAAPKVPPPENAADYYPLAAGWRWAYEIQEQGGENVLATFAVLERMMDTAIVASGESRITYAVLPEGIARREGMEMGDFILKTPIRKGAEWPIAGGRARVVAVGETVTTDGGTFTNCAIVEESRSNPDRVSRTTYAAGVGPVALEQQIHDQGTGRFVVQTRARLRGVTRPGEDPLGGEPPAPPPN
jgi:hypothetical protein